MKRSTSRPKALRWSSPQWHPQRWASHDAATLTKEHLQQQVESGLGEDDQGRPLRIDTDAKTITTAAGELPISPVFDPAWMQKRKRQRKADPEKPHGRFRTKLVGNPYARALSQPMRKCGLTGMMMPRSFLQDLEMVQHPETGKAWFAPGPLAFEKVEPQYRPTETTDTAESIVESRQAADPRPQRAPLTIYALSSKSLFDPLTPKNKIIGKLGSLRTGSAMASSDRGVVFREDLGEVILKQMRRQVVDTLITRAKRTKSKDLDLNKFLCSVESWDEVKDVLRRACVLWIPGDGVVDAAVLSSEYATLDLQGVGYDRKLPVYNLNWLLGEREVARLRETVPEFFGGHSSESGEKGSTIAVLRHWPSHSMSALHMLLWRLHGYLAEDYLTQYRDQIEDESS